MTDLFGKVAFVTGGARGIGRAQAISLAKAGADVAVVDIAGDIIGHAVTLGRESDLEATASAVRASGRRAVSIRADVRSTDDMRRAASYALEALGSIDLLICNAGIGSASKKAWEIAEPDWERMLAVNLTGAWLTCKHAVPHMLRRRDARIVFTASTAGLRGYEGIADYCAAKFGLIGLMKTLAIELAPHGITVNAICPGSVDTEGNRGVAASMGMSLDEMTTFFRSYQLLKPIFEPQDIANATVWLCSGQARYVTGHALPVDGGATS
jgi:NAD(P)-dependent dehydrogenase (short-subunit alcohol dehydrogenase family)